MEKVYKNMKEIDITSIPMEVAIEVVFDKPSPMDIPLSGVQAEVALAHPSGQYVSICRKCSERLGIVEPFVKILHDVKVNKVMSEKNRLVSKFVYTGRILILCTGAEDHDLGVLRHLIVELRY